MTTLWHAITCQLQTSEVLIAEFEFHTDVSISKKTSRRRMGTL